MADIVIGGWAMRSDIAKIINNNREEVPYEGTEINITELVNDIVEYVKNNNFILPKEKFGGEQK